MKQDQREPFRTALQDLREAAPKHTADEEESLFPRLRRQKDSRLLAVLARIESLEEEHLCADGVDARWTNSAATGCGREP